jgi:signal transduction histidine kinase
MSDLRRGTAWTLAGVSVVSAAAQVSFLAAAGVPLFSADALDQAFPIITIAVVVGAVIGAVIVQRHPRHRIGWLFCIGQAGSAVGLAAQALARAVLSGRLAWPEEIGHLAAWLARLLGGIYAITLIGCLLLLVPDGRLRSRRWRPVLGLLVVGYLTVVVALLMVNPSQLGLNGPVDTPTAASIVDFAGSVATCLGLVGAAVCLVVRLRTARGVERQQLRWISAAAVALVVTLTVMILVQLVRGDGGSEWYLEVLFYLAYLGVPVATGVAVLRYRLYQIDLIIGSAVRIAVVGAFVAAGYVVVVVVVSPAIGATLGTAGQWPSVLAYVLVALAFQPLRRYVDRLANRIVYGARAAPYDSLVQFGRRLSVSRTPDDLLLSVAESCAEAVGARAAAAMAVIQGRGDLTARWPLDADVTPDVTLPVRLGSAEVGRIELTLAPGRSLTRADRSLLDEFADRAGPAFRNVALAATLARRGDELADLGREIDASRRRLTAAADAELESVARAIGAQVTARLQSLPTEFEDLAVRISADPRAVQARLIELQATVAGVIETLRDITAGVLPPLLARRGLAAALQGYADKPTVRARLRIEPDLIGRRFPSDVEAAAYFCVTRAVATMTGPTEISVGGGPALRVQIRSASQATGRQQIVDRVEAVGGRLSYHDGTLQAVIPLPVVDSQAAMSESGPKVDFSM